MTVLVSVECTDFHGKPYTALISASDISVVKPRPYGDKGCIIERVSQPEFAIWTTDTPEQVNAKLKKAGVKMVP